MTQRHPDRRTALITAGAIAAVVIAGAFAVGANIGILDASADNQIGTLAAAGDLVATTVGPSTPTTTAPATSITSATSASSAATSATYAVDQAGTVEITMTESAMTVSAVTVNPGWTSASGPADATRAEVTFSDGRRSLVFTAARSTDGTIDVGVDEAAPAATATTPTTARGDHDDHEDHEHEGRDDDD